MAPRSTVWQHFTRLTDNDKKCKCNYCGNEFECGSVGDEIVARDFSQDAYRRATVKMMFLINCLFVLWRIQTSITTVSYMVIIAHFINKDLNLHRKIISFNTDNDHSSETIGKAPKCDHMQGVGKFVTPSLYFQTCQRPADRNRQREDRLWRESINRQLEEMRNELRKTPRHSDIASSSYPRMPVENNNAVGDDGIEFVQAEAVAETPKTKDEGKKVTVKPLPAMKNTRHAGGVQRNKILLLQLFGTMCEAKMPDQEWIPYLLDYGVFQLEGIRAHIEGVTAVQMLYASILPGKRGVKPFGFVRPGLVSLGEECNPTASFDLRHVDYHWVLVIFDVLKKEVYYLDSYGGDLDDDLKELIKVPQQPASSVVCGFYVMRFMKYLINDFSLLMNNFNGKTTYSDAELDELLDIDAILHILVVLMLDFHVWELLALSNQYFLLPLVLLEMNYVVAFLHVGRNDSVVGFLMLLELN
ncbi:hypothetical protein WN944_018474 [Citrus x changshan-huyou]|uniref:BED-type domain-containing protein n=1 Tax=Citrus x changshan-huyou TaxID=2935761 RepID=A0AAP0QFH1_9ROSI